MLSIPRNVGLRKRDEDGKALGDGRGKKSDAERDVLGGQKRTALLNVLAAFR